MCKITKKFLNEQVTAVQDTSAYS